LKFTSSGQVTIIADHDGDGTVAVAVADTGAGIAEEQQRRIFEPFAQSLVTSGSAGLRGTGLGLSISHRLATALGGSIELESRVGEGSKFTLRLPIGREAA
jgi:signal transduction histidine kinase